MKRKTLIALAVASLFAAPFAYAASGMDKTLQGSVIAMTDALPDQQEDNADLIRLPNPVLIAEGDEKKDSESTQLIAEGDKEKGESADLIAEGDEKKDSESTQLIAEGEDKEKGESADLIAEGDEKKDGESTQVIAEGEDKEKGETADLIA
jgi:hypothetical protein